VRDVGRDLLERRVAVVGRREAEVVQCRAEPEQLAVRREAGPLPQRQAEAVGAEAVVGERLAGRRGHQVGGGRGEAGVGDRHAYSLRPVRAMP
jgi:hypothetical protein